MPILFQSSKLAALLLPAMLSALALTGCQQPAREKPAALESIRASVITVKPVPVQDYSTVAGTVNTRERVKIASKILGLVTELHCHEGSRVGKGQLLIRIDDRDALSRLDAARAQLTQAEHELDEAEQESKAAESARSSAEAEYELDRDTFNRYEALFKRNSVSQQEFDGANARYRTAAAQLAQAQNLLAAKAARRKQALARIQASSAAVKEARVSLSYSRIYAPKNGVIASKNVDVGDMATPGAPLLVLEAEQYRLEVPVDESRVVLIHPGDPVPVNVEALGKRGVSAPVSEMVPAADPSTRSLIIKLSLPDMPGLRSGMFGQANFPLGRRHVIAVPAASIINRGQLTTVYVVDQNGIARLRLVKTGKIYGDLVEILSGLSAGETVVVGSLTGLRDGVRVEM